MRALLVLSLVLVLAACGFDRARWAAARGVDASDNPRASMVCDAVAAGVAPGARKANVRALLGAPDFEGEVTDVYEVGLEFTSPDEVSLSIGYGGEGVVERVALRHDWGHEVLRPQVRGTRGARCDGEWGFYTER
jgi:hypothetical protein